ncbi:protein turtle homolog B-like [Stigmatopora argus]
MTDMRSRRSDLQTLSAVVLCCLFWSIDGGTPEVRGKVGGVAELACNVESDLADESSGSLHVVEWVREGLDNPVLIKFGSYAPRVHPQYEGRVSLVGITTLKLEGLQLDDQGPYECRILLLDKATPGIRNGTWIILSVLGSPSFTKSPPPVLEGMVGGGPLSLVCAAIGNPLPTITWLKDGAVIQIGNNQEEALSLTAVSFQSAGQYTCHAHNSEGNATLQTKVKIKGPPVIIVPPKSTFVNISHDALLDCQAVADPSNMTYEWLKGGENVYHLESLKSRVKILVDGTLLVSNLIPEDSGNYTCVPTNGLLTPPTASANLTVMHPAKALPMPAETYLPSGMDGMLNCFSIAHPPLLRVEWTKDGEPLDLTLYPGWTLTPEGNLLMATVNDDAKGAFTCTPFNSYGTMGKSGQTKVILQEPPSFGKTPEKQYKQKVGRTLLIPCQGNDDSTVNVNWTKVDLARHIPYSITPNGSLLLRPLIKDHHGTWECTVFNRVAHVKAFTQIFVLGTSPHVATSLTVSSGMKQANISWEAGFDGGSPQTFSVWVKEISGRDNEGKREWFSVPVPVTAISATALLVTGLSPATKYQFSLLSRNKIGSGPFSQIITAWTLDPAPIIKQLKPPSSLLAILGSSGVVLRWSIPPTQPLAITGFVLQSRVQQGEWINLHDDISANISKMIVPGLQKDRVYELRLLSRRGELLSEPSPSLNVSTVGMQQVYPSSFRILEVPESLLPIILGGLGFMCLMLVLLIGIACIISHRKNQQRQKKRNEPSSGIYKSPISIKISDSASTDGALKKSLLPASSLYPTTSSTISSSSSSSSKTDCSSFNSENKHHKQQLLSDYRRSLNQFQCLNSRPVSSSVELISRGPDGRFVIPPYDPAKPPRKESTIYDPPFTISNSGSLCSHQQDAKNPPFVLSVDLPPCKQQNLNTTQHLNEGIINHDESHNVVPDLTSKFSNSDSSSISIYKNDISPTFPVLPHLRSGLNQASTTASTLVLQMEHERERGNLTHCLKLAKEREELARELQRYSVYRCATGGRRRGKQKSDKRDESELIRDYRSQTLPCRYKENSPKSFDHLPRTYSSSVHWNDFSTAITDGPSTLSNSFLPNPGHRRPTLSSATEIPLQSEGEDHCSDGRLTPLHLSPTKKDETVQETPRGYNHVQQSAFVEMQRKISASEARGQNRPYFHCQIRGESSNLPPDAGPACQDTEEDFPELTEQNVGIEMSVDEPVFAVSVKKPIREGCPHKAHYQEMRRSTSFHYQEKSSRPKLRRVVSQGSKLADPGRQGQNQNTSRQKDTHFLPPDAWINSLSRGKHPDSSTFHPESVNNSSPARNLSFASSDSPTSYRHVIQPPNGNPRRSTNDCKLSTDVFVFPRATKWPDEHRLATIRNALDSLGTTSDSSRYVEPRNGNQHHNRDAHEAEPFEEVADSGGSYSSFASSGRGSMEPANRRLSLCHLPTNMAGAPETVREDGQESAIDTYHHQIKKCQRRTPSVDENYEWDEVDVSSQQGDDHDLPLSLNRQTAVLLCSPLSRKFSTKELTNLSQSCILQKHQISGSALPEPKAVLF